ncbi:uncharacterized protein LOC129602805 isoform X2 [Paramacrobiotus metropolitanus]|uniref:uncharacterized protein LOC129602805 isoform X2 n=1 Tax=Paramacrobiotus metropolitanus TaxID=2943436 RepID=UPI002445BA38|nr:uncharacterized protein LOC129602805 isoform X2 [Paramacrobiotus metropolitanus]
MSSVRAAYELLETGIPTAAMFDCKTNRYDILGDDNVFRSGRVVDVAVNGLFIDFCPSRRREFVHFKRVFQNMHPIIEKEVVSACTIPEANFPVDVLRPETPNGPLAWLPARIVSVARGMRRPACSVAIAEWMENGVACTDLVPLKRLRWRDHGGSAKSMASGRVAKFQPVRARDFKKRSVALPDECRHVDVDKLLLLLNDKACCSHLKDCSIIYFVDVTDGRVSFIEEERRTLHYHFLTEIRKCRDPLISRIRYIAGMLADGNSQPTSIDDVNVLSSDDWLHVFSQLDTRTQTGLRGVCCQWNSILESPVLTTCILVTSSASDYQWVCSQLHYFLLSPIFHRLRRSTQHIVLDDRQSQLTASDFLPLAGMIDYICLKAGNRLRMVHVLGFPLKLQAEASVPLNWKFF